MTVSQRHAAVAFFCMGFLAMLLCTPNPRYRNFHPSATTKTGIKPVVETAPRSVAGAGPAAAFPAPVQQPDTPQSVTPRSDVWELDRKEIGGGARASSASQNAWYADGSGFHAPTAHVRVMVRQNATQARVVTSAPMTVKSSGSGPAEAMTFSGAATVERAGMPGRARVVADNGENREVALPCTLYCGSEFNIVKIDGSAYRGSVVIAPAGPVFSIINYVAVDDYLRGVVPLEVGRGSDEVIEAVKAQAIAARTYTFRKMQENAGDAFDLMATVSDQVYGGVAVESELCNRAIHATEAEVMVCRDSLIYAYYHSTCGGRTANIEDVWNKTPAAYLKSVDDGNGPYCRQSGSFAWEEQWPAPQFSFIVNKYSREAFPQNPCRGEVRDISIRSKFRCGRIRELFIRTSEGEFLYGGDKVRFALRRNTSGFPILKSSWITDVSVRGGTVVIRGRGYGHGVGLCQMGALGRAKNGMNYKDILRAYYSGIEIKKITLNR
jgi:stage II sporulation protein D